MGQVRATIHHGDAVAWLRTLQAGGADGLITDPPYSSGGAFRSDRTGTTGAKYGKDGGLADLPDFHGDNRDQRGHLVWSHLWLSAAYDALREGAFVAVFTDWRMLPTTTDALQAGGFVWRGVFVWHKPAARPQQGRPASACEYAVWGSKGPMRMDGPPHVGHVSESPPSNRVHQTEKPLGVLRALARVVPVHGLILDPFAGSGSMGEAALLEDRRYAGCELSREYSDVARRRLADVRPQVGLL